jgi:hypothetical protein
MMFAPVEPVPAQRPTSGLVAQALTPQDGARWQGGMAWRPERCFGVRMFSPCATDVQEVQTLTIVGGPTGGTFTITWNGQTTAGIAYNASAAAVLAALVALSNIAPGDLTVSGANGGPYTLTWAHGKGNVSAPTTNAAGLTGGVAPAVNVATVTAGSALYSAPLGVGSSGTVYYLPQALRVEDECKLLGGLEQLTEAAIKRQTEAASAYVVARELWTGDLSDTAPYATPDGGGVVNARLASTDAVVVGGGNAHAPNHALGLLEQEARRGALGQDVWIHVPVELFALFTDLEQRGGAWFTRSGARIIADPGYLGTEPDGDLPTDRLWMYATGPVQVRLGDITTQLFDDQRFNVRRVNGERMFAATFDPCIHYGIAAALPDTTT